MTTTSTALPLILVVDDNPINLRVVGGELKNSGQYRIIFANSGAEAIEQVYAEPPDLILLDIMMPEMSGHEVCSRLKQDAKTGEIPIIFLTAMNQTEDVVKGFELGGADYITKPFNPTILLSRVSTHVQLYLAHQRDQEVKERERHHDYLNGLTQMRIEILHNIGNSLNNLDTSVNNKRRFKEHMATLGKAIQNADALLENERRRDRVHEVLRKSAEMLMEVFPKQFEKDFQRLVDVQEYTLGIIDALQDLGEENLHPSTIDLPALLEEVRVLMQGELHRLHIELTVEGERAVEPLYLPRGPLGQVLFSLLKNSCESIELQQQQDAAHQGSIVIRIESHAATEDDEAWYQLDIEDNGVGINPADLSQVFSKDFTTKGRRVGFGLHSAANFILSEQGRLKLFSDGVGQGAVARLQLPIRQPQ